MTASRKPSDVGRTPSKAFNAAHRRSSALMRSDSKASANGHSADGPGAWCPFASMFDLELTDVPVFQPPVASYVEEAIIGMRWGAGDTRAKRDEGKDGLCNVGPVPTWRRVEMLSELLCSTNANNVCKSLFWIALSVVFHRSTPVLGALQKELSDSWHLLTLAAAHQLPRDVIDWAKVALPFVFAQAIFRLFCDTFESDRKSFISHSFAFIDKLTLVIHFELTGFQVNVETVHKERRRLFLRRVVSCPHANQHELMEGIKRQEALENASALSSNKPLAFVQAMEKVEDYIYDSRPFDEATLEHVMQGRAACLSKESAVNQSPTALAFNNVSAHISSGPPEELSVDRYHSIINNGNEFLERHLKALENCIENPPNSNNLEEDDADIGSEDSPASSETPTHSPPASPKLSLDVRQSLKTAWAEKPGAMDDLQDAAEFSAQQRRSLNWNSVAKGARRASVFVSKQKQEKQKRVKQEMIHKCIIETSLPEEYCDRTLNTGWVSPAHLRMTPDLVQRLDALQKSPDESRMLKMSPPVQMKGSSLSTPALRKYDKESNRHDTGEDSRRTSSKRPSSRGAHDAKSVSQASLRDDGSTVVGAARPMSQGGRPRRISQEGLGASATNASLPNSVSGHLASSGSMKNTAEPTECLTISLAPPKNLTNDQILQRLEAQAKVYRQNTFSEYMRNTDMLTGNKKTRSDKNRLREEEQAFVRKMNHLVGGPPQRMIPLSKFKLVRGS